MCTHKTLAPEKHPVLASEWEMACQGSSPGGQNNGWETARVGEECLPVPLGAGTCSALAAGREAERIGYGHSWEGKASVEKQWCPCICAERLWLLVWVGLYRFSPSS